MSVFKKLKKQFSQCLNICTTANKTVKPSPQNNLSYNQEFFEAHIETYRSSAGESSPLVRPVAASTSPSVSPALTQTSPAPCKNDGLNDAIYSNKDAIIQNSSMAHQSSSLNTATTTIPVQDRQLNSIPDNEQKDQRKTANTMLVQPSSLPPSSLPQPSDDHHLIHSSATPPPDLSSALEVFLGQVAMYIDQKSWQKALATCDRVLELSPNTAESYKLKGNILQHMGHPADAMGYYAEALVIQPNYPEVHANLGVLYGTLENWQKAVACYEKAIALNPGFVGAYRHLAKAWEKLEQPENRLDTLYQALSLSPETFTAGEHYEMGQHLLEQGQDRDAIECLRRAIALDPTHTNAHKLIAQCLEQQGDWEQAVYHYNQTLSLVSETKPLDSGSAEASSPLKSSRSLTSLPSTQSVQHGAIDKPSDADRNGQGTSYTGTSYTDTSYTGTSYTGTNEQDTEQDARQASVEALVGLAQSYAEHGNWQKAIAHYKNALQLDPDNAHIYRELANGLEQVGEPNQAIESRYRMLCLQPDWGSAQDYYRLGCELQQKNEPEKAIDFYRQALQRDAELTQAAERLAQLTQPDVKTLIKQDPIPSVSIKFHQQGEAFAQEKQWDEAIAAYQSAIQYNPTFFWSHHNLGDALRAVKRWEEAALSYQQAIALDGSCGWSHYNLGDALFQLERWDEAAIAYQDAFALAPDLSEIRLKIAKSLKRQAQRHLEQAQEFYTDAFEDGDQGTTEIYHQVLSQDPSNVDGYIRLADTLVEQENDNGAIAFYDIALQIDPHQPTIYRKLGQVLVNQRDFQSATTILQTAIEQGERDYLTYYNLGLSLEKMNRVDDAIAAYEGAIAQNANHFESLLGLGLLLNQKRDFASALNPLQNALTIEADNADLFTGIGQAWLGQNNLKEAVKWCQKAVELEPDNWNAQRYLGDSLRRQGRRKEAMNVYELVTTLNPRFPGAYNSLGDIYREQERWEQAEDAYLSFLEHTPKHFSAHQNLGTVLAAQGKWDTAIEHYQEALNIQPNNANLTSKLDAALEEKSIEERYKKALDKGKKLKEEAQLEDAAIFLREAIRIHPDDFDAYVEIADVLRQQNEHNESVRFFLDFHKRCPTTHKIYNPYIWTDWRKVKVEYAEEAIRTCQRSLKEISSNCYDLLAQVNLTIGHIQTAIDLIDEAIDSFKNAATHSLCAPKYEDIKNALNDVDGKPGSPDFFLIGGMKCGSTSMFSYITQHPHVAEALQKEIHFFSTAMDQYKYGLDWYLAHFLPIPQKGRFITGEASPCIGQHGVAQRVAEHFPNLKLIVLLRNPIDRALSHYGHNRNWYRQTHDFESAIEAVLNDERLRQTTLSAKDIHQWVNCHYIKLGMYAYFLEEWLQFFSQKNFLILQSEHFYADLPGTMSQVFKFLDLPDFEVPNYSHKLKGRYESMAPELREKLYNFYRPHNQRLENLLGRTFEWE